jgi:transcriptional regulator with XRE-family HTH domain
MTEHQHPESGVETTTEQELLSQRLRNAREYLGFSQELVAERLGVPRASISAIETGKLASLYKTSTALLLGEELAQAEPSDDEGLMALFRTTKDLDTKDREQVLRFAEFLRNAGRAPDIKKESE